MVDLDHSSTKQCHKFREEGEGDWVRWYPRFRQTSEQEGKYEDEASKEEEVCLYETNTVKER
jgi:hypothetical protein